MEKVHEVGRNVNEEAEKTKGLKERQTREGRTGSSLVEVILDPSEVPVLVQLWSGAVTCLF